MDSTVSSAGLAVVLLWIVVSLLLASGGGVSGFRLDQFASIAVAGISIGCAGVTHSEPVP